MIQDDIAIPAIAFIAVVFVLLAKAGGRSRGGRSKSTTVAAKSSAMDGCQVRTKPIMSTEQGRVHEMLIAILADRNVYLCPEVSLSAVFTLRHPGDSNKAFAARGTFSQKYVDFLVTDHRHLPICGIEYHGSGHRGGTSEIRDAAKRRVFEMAGLPLVEVEKGVTAETLRARVEGVLPDKVRRRVPSPPGRAPSPNRRG
ncbi:DUF2726 domain-containing protein [Jannaschia sp. M317]|uniref:DUF2726 domain-containing protein n=1 Tax=Jannaschia sp. M317 TaxID=2867011 RepID=UPI0021A5EB9D|nr:DUF2726 domain-containing protein [Jannaschia sp. M317]UWQ17554.1 DUF2726 domain-containing protein [Jannaschia sp. M317]